jgi:prepilin-type N-terminal cleavage/methylation domain-containing protein
MKSHSNQDRERQAGRTRRVGGFSLLEMIAVVAVVALLVTLVMGSPGLITSGRDTTAVQELASVIESARARSMRGVEEVWVAFGENNAPQPFAAYVVCVDAQDGSGDLVPVAAWKLLPPGLVFTDTNPAVGTSGVNLLELDGSDHYKTVRTADGRVVCKSIGFGALGEVIVPRADNRTLLVAFGPGQVAGSNTEAMGGGDIPPEKCNWVSVQPATGKVTITP